MATTLGLLNFPILAQKNNTPFIHSKMPLLSNSSKLDVCKKDSHSPRKLFTETIQHLSSASLSPASLALPFLLDTKASHRQAVLEILFCSNLSFSGLNCWPFFFLDCRMRLLLVGSLGYWREGHLHLSTPLWWVVYYSTLCGLDIWGGNGGVLGPHRMRSVNLKGKWNLPQLLLKAHLWKLHHLLLNSKFSNSVR